MAVLGFGPPGVAARLAAMPITQLEEIIDTTDVFADDADGLKLRGLYVDMDREPVAHTAHPVPAPGDAGRQEGMNIGLPPPASTCPADAGAGAVVAARLGRPSGGSASGRSPFQSWAWAWRGYRPVT